MLEELQLMYIFILVFVGGRTGAPEIWGCDLGSAKFHSFRDLTEEGWASPLRATPRYVYANVLWVVHK